ncbi:hypothetical protein E2C01_011747 [Portunus trituberculatus]|uniref:C2H2-type domain-containing protein n=1 Tax=Portunus trituberculatus TaxID=210409 RepID=A0A5B7DBV1_PORTR|nr:hypothetical protein [Portunus trituberculatus]
MNTKTKTSITSPELYSPFIIHNVGASSLFSAGDVMPDVPLGHRGEMFITSSIVCEELDEELNQETGENTQVTIIISDSSATDKNGVSLTPSHTLLGASPAPWSDPFFLRRCLEQCLKLTTPERIDVCCFLCSETCKSFSGLKKHLRESHNLSHSITQLPNLPAECISEIAKEIKKLECKCLVFVCPTCEVTFRHLLKLVQHVLLDHPTRCGDFTFFAEQQQKSHLEKCQRCMILDKLCHVDYDLFVRVLLECVECCDEECRALLLSWPLAHYAEPCEWCAKEEEDKEHSGDSPSTHGTEREVVCYRIKLEHSDKLSQKSASECICPLMKCPECPKTLANYADLRKHVRQNNHSSWHDLRLIWEKYKTIKENCPVCPKHSYHKYILCPHCPHLNFESERDAQTHMNSHHNTQAGNKLHGVCTCPNYFLCLKCNTSYPTPQSLHWHMRQMQHETPENLAAIPAMIQDNIGSREGCPHCSLQGFLSASGSLQREEKCSCRWAECSTCKTSFKRVGGLLDHILRAKHPMSARDIRKERQKVASSMITCQRCCIEANKYCVLCHHKENFMYTHLRTLHQDCQIMLLRDHCGNVLEEHHQHHMGSSVSRGPARYQCSVCHVCHPRVSELLCHVRHQHPHCHFTLLCLDLSEDIRQVKDLAGHDHLMLLSVVDKKL